MKCIASPYACLIAAGLTCLAGGTGAQTVDGGNRTIHSIVVPVGNLALDTAQSREWGLSVAEWTRYSQLMRGPLGIYSPNLDPLTALGIEARSDEERRHYAEMQVRAEAQRVRKELDYQQAYDAAWKRLYPDQPPLRALTLTPNAGTTGATTARQAVFVKDDCPACDARVRALQASGAAFDIYMVGSRGDDARIRSWAARVGIDTAKVRARIITLNHDAGRWLMLGGQGDLPAVLPGARSP
ncbi:integrating conjugative element protein, PFL_4693 family [Burkholderia pseudomallei]|uniref:TIGR03759 family integrating conjugative element protein n=1 Tax=Burkholderia pseudomallei TaxID=28450 RepID=UPI0005DD578B|nr:TIGR03759 family integrating conjugative element protein [Burkholderia pseudomallei]CAJ9899198.1 integrating conjugative element protein, PFL_4693 family [Burkholderia pseudomallei]CFL69312.1 integrating conjugative element protein%2C PFL_4693 family [Burkholderia pseudomallei]CPI59046.1 integrating conjugative element protein%2C PFL_4693 family [Burkholderia pseudomallei]